MGTRRLGQGPEEPVAIARMGAGFAVATRTGGVTRVDGTADWSTSTGVVAGHRLAASPFRVALCGDTDGGRIAVTATHDGARRDARALPPRAVVGAVDDRLVVARSGESGLYIGELERVPPEDTPTRHALQVCAGGVIGVGEAGVGVWTAEDGAWRSWAIKLWDVVNAAIAPDHDHVALGTRSGGVALARVRVPGSRANPPKVEAHDGPVRAIGFSTRGRWLATAGGDRVQVWSY